MYSSGTPIYPPTPEAGWTKPMLEKVEVIRRNTLERSLTLLSRHSAPRPSAFSRPRLRPPPKGPNAAPPGPINGLTQRPSKSAGWEEPKHWEGGAECCTVPQLQKMHPSQRYQIVTRVVEGYRTGLLSLSSPLRSAGPYASFLLKRSMKFLSPRALT